MPQVAMSWDLEAQTLGYKSEKTMLEDLYLKQGWSLQKIGSALGYAHCNVRHRLKALGIPLRTRGGKNRGTPVLSTVSDAELEDVPKTAKKYGLHESTVYNEKRRRRIKLCNMPPSLPSSTSSTSVEEKSLEPSSSSLSTHSEYLNTEVSTAPESESTKTSSSSTTEPTKDTPPTTTSTSD